MTERSPARTRIAALASALALIACAWSAPTQAADISVVGLMPNRAVVQIDGGSPRIVAIGQKAGDSATLVSVEKDGATFNVDGKRRSIKLGEAPLSAPTSSSPTASLTSDSRGHFMADGQVNGQAIRFIVDTGATMVSLSSADARRLGINYLAGQPTQLSTANGVAQAWRVRLDSVRVANITINNVDAVVMDNAAMPALLGMSFLNRTDMKREGNIMTLVKKF